MTPDNAVSAIKGQLGNWTGTSIDTWCLNELNAAVRRLQRNPILPWFLEEDDSVSLVTVAGTETVDLPADFLREDEETLDSPLFVWSETKWLALQKADYSVMLAKYPTESQIPKMYALRGSQIYLRPVPDAAYNLRLLYFKSDAVIAAGSTETVWLTETPDLLIAEAGRVIAGQYLKDQQAAQMFLSRVKEERLWLDTEIVARQEAGRLRIMGDR